MECSYRKAFELCFRCDFVSVGIAQGKRESSELVPAVVLARGLRIHPSLFVAPRPFLENGKRRSSADLPSVRAISAQCCDTECCTSTELHLTIQSVAAREELAMSARAGPGDREHDRAPPDAQKDQLEELARPCIILCSKSASSPHGVGQANSTRDRLTTQ